MKTVLLLHTSSYTFLKWQREESAFTTYSKAKVQLFPNSSTVAVLFSKLVSSKLNLYFSSIAAWGVQVVAGGNSLPAVLSGSSSLKGSILISCPRYLFLFLTTHDICPFFTPPHFQAKNFTPQKCVICDTPQFRYFWGRKNSVKGVC